MSDPLKLFTVLAQNMKEQRIGVDRLVNEKQRNVIQRLYYQKLYNSSKSFRTALAQASSCSSDRQTSLPDDDGGLLGVPAVCS